MLRLLCMVFQGLPSKLLFAHCGVPSSHHLMTHYEESYGRNHTNTLPNLQSWHADSLTWQPERSERPISGKKKINRVPCYHCLKVQIIHKILYIKPHRHRCCDCRTNIFSMLNFVLTKDISSCAHEQLNLGGSRCLLLFQISHHCN